MGSCLGPGWGVSIVKIHGAEKMQGLEDKPNQKYKQLSKCLTVNVQFTVVPNPFDILSHVIFSRTL